MRVIASRLIWLIIGMSLGGFVLDGQPEVRIVVEMMLGLVVAILWAVDRYGRGRFLSQKSGNLIKPVSSTDG